MAWQYAVICLFDFMIAPTAVMAVSIMFKVPYVPWAPLTLQLGGFYHMSMMGIVGVAAWTRGQEKLETIKSEKKGE